MGSAAESKQECVAAYENAQTAKLRGKLLDGKAALLLCSSSACPEVMHADCDRWLTEVEASLPTVVFRVMTASGVVPQWATVSIDGAEPVALDGRAISVDPGRHTVTFSAQDLRTTSQTFDFSEGEKLRREVIVLQPNSRSATPGANESTAPVSANSSSRFKLTLPLTLAASTAVLGTLGATYFGLSARADDRDLDKCSPNCSRDSVDRVKREYLLANLSLGIAAVGLVTSTVVILLQSGAEASSPAAQVAVGASANQINLGLSGRF
jgi:hypothetical protein